LCNTRIPDSGTSGLSFNVIVWACGTGAVASVTSDGEGCDTVVGTGVGRGVGTIGVVGGGGGGGGGGGSVVTGAADGAVGAGSDCTGSLTSVSISNSRGSSGSEDVQPVIMIATAISQNCTSRLDSCMFRKKSGILPIDKECVPDYWQLVIRTTVKLHIIALAAMFSPLLTLETRINP